MEVIGKYVKDCKIYADTVEDKAMDLVYDILNCKAFDGQKIRIMPDVHAGKGIVIGFTSTLGDYICPSHVGVDIGCKMTTLVLSHKMPQDKIALFENNIKRDIPMGFNINKKKMFEDKEFYKFLNSELSKAYSSWSDMIYNDTIDEKYITNMLKRIGMDEGKFYKSIMSVGGGNHFLEYGEVEGSDYGYFTIHCGSRNFGLMVCKYWENRAKKNGNIDTSEYAKALDKLKNETEDKSTLPAKIEALKASMLDGQMQGYLTGNDMRGYLTDMVIAQAYANYNHRKIAEMVYEIYKRRCGGCNMVEVIETTHNYINFADHIIRKGSVQANLGQKVILPFNMRDGVAICIGKGNEDWNCSAPHGCGRIMSRTKAKETITLDEYKKSMDGIYTTCINKSTLDEAPMAYKDKDEILKLIEPTLDVQYFIKPIINLKAAE